jgi:serine protease Do
VNKPFEINMNDTMKQTIKKVSTRLRAALLGGALILGGGSLAFSHLTQAKERPKNAQTVPARLSVNDASINRDGRFTTSFAPVVKQVAPSVVKVFTTTKPRTMSPRSMPPDDFFRRFFGFGDEFDGSDGNGNPRGRGFRAPRQHGLGSGVIVTKDGYILTNNHVVENADDIMVALNDGREFNAKAIGRDPKTDVAVLKIENEDLPFLTLTDSDKLEVGDLVLAIGNPFGIGQTVTMGMVSAKGRTLLTGDLGRDRYEDFIQTDAAINPGNSGGALVDTEGRLIGINTAIISETGGNMGIGFAVPVNLARFVMESIIKDGRVIRGYMGVSIQDVSDALAKEFKLKDKHGALVGDVTPKSPAEKAGIKSGDVIVEFNGKPVEDSRTLKLRAAQVPPGSKVQVELVRDGTQKTVAVALEEFPDKDVASRSSRSDKDFADPLDGVTVGDIDRNLRAQMDLPANVRGAVVMKIDPESPSFEHGLREGDVIQEINRQPVRNADDAVKLSENIKNDAVLLKVWSRGGTHYVVVEQKK